MSTRSGQVRPSWLKRTRAVTSQIVPRPSGRQTADASAIDGICLSHYDDAYDRIWGETYKGGPWGLRAWLQFARDKGRKIGFGEWGVGRDGDNPQYIQDMYDFFKDAGRDLAYEAYFNTGSYQLYPVRSLPRSSALYRDLF